MSDLGYMQVTRRCNQKCRFCSNPEREEHLSLDAGIANINELKKQGYLCVLFTGGEPTLSEHLPAYLSHCREINFMNKLCTNGQTLANPEYLKTLIDNGLQHVCLSLHSCRPAVQNFISQNPGSLENIMRALNNLASHPEIIVDILTTINSYNADHLSETVKFLVEYFPFISNFTWNNIDPRNNRATDNPDTIPRLRDFQLELFLAMEILSSLNIPFQVERVPLCYMSSHPDRSSETRRIVKNVQRLTYFLDERGKLLLDEWSHDKAECCSLCSLDAICAGLFEMDRYYSSSELFPVFLDRSAIEKQIVDDVTVVKRRRRR